MTTLDRLLFAALAVVWGVPYLFIKIGLEGFAPVDVAFFRVALGALLLAPFVPRAAWRPALRRSGAIALIAFTDVALPFVLIANGERWVTSSLTGLLLAAIPIVVTLVVMTFDRHERPTRPQAVGLTLGFGGVAALLGFGAGGSAFAPLGAWLIVGAMLSYSVGIVIIQRYARGIHPLAMTVLMLAYAAAMLALPALLSLPHAVPPVSALGAVAVLGIACTSAAYAMYLTLVAHIGATKASVVNYLCPGVAVLVGALTLHEPIGVVTVVGLACIIAGSWLATGAGRSAAVAERAAA